jgi:hypothetical protein
MANKVLLKKSSTAAKVPLTSDLDYGELALNYTDGKLYYKTAGNTIDTFPSISATATLTNKTLTAPIINYADFTGTAPTLAAGRMWYNSTDGSWNLGMGNGNITQQIGEELFRYGKASSAITDSPLQLVYKTGVVGGSGVITFAPAVAGITDSDQIIGIATESIALNGFGRVTAYGVVNNITTNGTAYGETWADNDDIYYNPATGGLTKTLPSAPGLKVLIGTVITAGSGGAGKFIVKLGSSTTLAKLSDVQITSRANADVVTYDSTAGYWKNITRVSLFTSPAMSGTPTAPTAAAGTVSTQVATTAFADDVALNKAVAMAIALG